MGNELNSLQNYLASGVAVQESLRSSSIASTERIEASNTVTLKQNGNESVAGSETFKQSTTRDVSNSGIKV